MLEAGHNKSVTTNVHRIQSRKIPENQKKQTQQNIIIGIHNLPLGLMKCCLYVFFQFFLFIHQSSASQTHPHLLQDEAEPSKRILVNALELIIKRPHTYCHVLKRSVLCSRAGSPLSSVLHFVETPRVSNTDTVAI